MTNSDQNAVTTEPAQESKDQALLELKERADALNVPYHPNIGIEKLQMRIDAHLSVMDDKRFNTTTHHNQDSIATSQHVDEDTIKRQSLEKKRREQLKLVRIILNSNDPNRTEWEGEVITCSNDLVGTVKKFIPYGHEAGWHIPQIMLNTLREKQVQLHSQKVNRKTGVRVHTTRLVPAYSIEVLQPLNSQELDLLAKQQSNVDEID